jgi:Chain length determinant protein
VDLLTIWQSLWRNRWVALPVILLTGAAAFWALFVRPPVYESSASLLLLQPPAAPTEAQIRRDPTLARHNADNPYTRVYDPAVLIEVVAEAVQSDGARQALVAQGADPRYTVTNRVRYGFTSPLALITGTADTPERAMATTRLVTAAFAQQLRQLQANERVSPRYFVAVRRVDSGNGAVLRAADKIRALVALSGLGVIGLFGVISIADAVDKLRAQRRARGGTTRSRRGGATDDADAMRSDLPAPEATWASAPDGASPPESAERSGG